MGIRATIYQRAIEAGEGSTVSFANHIVGRVDISSATYPGDYLDLGDGRSSPRLCFRVVRVERARDGSINVLI